MDLQSDVRRTVSSPLPPRLARWILKGLYQLSLRRTGSSPYIGLQSELFPIGSHPFVAFDQHLAVSGHARFGEALRTNEPQLHADYLFDAVIAVISVFRSERRLRINARDDGFERLLRIRVEINAGRLPGAHASDLTFGNEGSQVDLGQVDYRHNRRTGRDDFTRFGGAGRDRAVKWSDDLQIAAIGHRLLQLRAGATGLGLSGLEVGLRLSDLLFNGRSLRGANRRVVEIGFGGERRSARSLDLFPRGLYDGFVRFGGGPRLLAFARRGVALFRQSGEAFSVGSRLFVIRFRSRPCSLCRPGLRLCPAFAAL